jgi:hypothetical protein
VIESRKYLAHALLRFFGLANVVVQVGHVMAWFVAMCILTDEPRNVGLFSAGSFACFRKEFVQLFFKSFGTAHQCYVSRNIVWYKE